MIWDSRDAHGTSEPLRINSPGSTTASRSLLADRTNLLYLVLLSLSSLVAVARWAGAKAFYERNAAAFTFRLNVEHVILLLMSASYGLGVNPLSQP